jgi:hypothetical protein
MKKGYLPNAMVKLSPNGSITSEIFLCFKFFQERYSQTMSRVHSLSTNNAGIEAGMGVT